MLTLGLMRVLDDGLNFVVVCMKLHSMFPNYHDENQHHALGTLFLPLLDDAIAQDEVGSAVST